MNGLDKKAVELLHDRDSQLAKRTARLPIVRTIGTDDVLAAALLWELWQRGVNRKLVDKETGRHAKSANASTSQNPATFARKCTDGLVLISEWDSDYARALSRNLTEGFSGALQSKRRYVAAYEASATCAGWTAYCRTSTKRAPTRRARTIMAKQRICARSLRMRRRSAPRGAASTIICGGSATRSPGSIAIQRFAQNGVKAIGIVGSDVYDKLLILQALRSRFKDKIFFTTDLDARYLHANQKEWARNLVVASNFDLSLRPALQQSTLPFRDGYQTATYLAALMALEARR